MSRDRTKAERFGRLAESLCLLRLHLSGFTILARRFRCPVGEIDLIAKRNRLLVFIEVKARSDGQATAHSLAPRQCRRIERAAGAFIAARPGLADLDIRFDLMLVRPWSWPELLVDAWRPDKP